MVVLGLRVVVKEVVLLLVGFVLAASSRSEEVIGGFMHLRLSGCLKEVVMEGVLLLSRGRVTVHWRSKHVELRRFSKQINWLLLLLLRSKEVLTCGLWLGDYNWLRLVTLGRADLVILLLHERIVLRRSTHRYCVKCHLLCNYRRLLLLEGVGLWLIAKWVVLVLYTCLFLCRDSDLLIGQREEILELLNVVFTRLGL